SGSSPSRPTPAKPPREDRWSALRERTRKIGGIAPAPGGVCRGVDDEARARFGEFAASRMAALLRVAYLLTGDQHAAEDLVQSALAKTYGRWRSVRQQDPEGYVRAVMYREQVSWWRRRGRHRETLTA